MSQEAATGRGAFAEDRCMVLGAGTSITKWVLSPLSA